MSNTKRVAKYCKYTYDKKMTNYKLRIGLHLNISVLQKQIGKLFFNDS